MMTREQMESLIIDLEAKVATLKSEQEFLFRNLREVYSNLRDTKEKYDTVYKYYHKDRYKQKKLEYELKKKEVQKEAFNQLSRRDPWIDIEC